MWIKKLPGIAANAAVLILDVFVILMIAALFLHQQTAGERVKETITRFSTTSQEYYSEGEAYSQKSDRVHTYAVEEASKQKEKDEVNYAPEVEKRRKKIPPCG